MLEAVSGRAFSFCLKKRFVFPWEGPGLCKISCQGALWR